MSASRREVFDVIDAERVYQERGLGNSLTDQPDKGVGEWVLLMEEAVSLARAEFYKPHPPGRDGALHMIRKVAALAVRCMEQHGAPPREFPTATAPFPSARS